MNKRRTTYIQLKGGINTETPALSLKSGELSTAQNYTVSTNGGYERVIGYERYDGHTSPSSLLLSDSGFDDATFQAAIETARADIDAVPGSGSILGVWMYKGVVYVFRNNVGGTAALMYKSTSSGWSLVTTPALQPSGRYEFVNENFKGDLSYFLMYGCDGVNPAFEFNGTTLTQITTTASPNTPIHLIPFKRSLWLGFASGAIYYSVVNDPTDFVAVNGAGQKDLGQAHTGFSHTVGDTLIAFTRNRTYIFTESYSDTYPFQSDVHSRDSGAVEYTCQSMGVPLYLDDRGITTINAVQSYGDFKNNTISKDYDRLLRELITKDISCSVRVREKNHYKLFFANGEAICITLLDGKAGGATRLDYGKNITTVCSSEDNNGNEVIFFGDDAGFVYQDNVGTSFDGSVIDAWLRTSFYNYNAPAKTKRFFKIDIELEASNAFNLYVLPDFSYGSPNFPSHAESEVDVTGGGGYFDSSYWSEFYWDAQAVSTAYAYISGIGTNMSLYIRSAGIYDQPHRLQGIIVYFSDGGLIR